METAESSKPHLLYVAWGFPPASGAGMYRALATANAFAEAGWDVTVLTTSVSSLTLLTTVDPRSESAVDPRIDVERVEFDTSRAEPDLARWSRGRVFSPLWWNFLKAKREEWSFPEARYGSWRHPLVERTLAIHRRKPVSLVIGTANPNVDFFPGYLLKKRFGVPHVMDYRDTWHLDMYSGKRIGSRRSRSARMERRLLESAHEVWFVNEAILGWHAAEFPGLSERFHLVRNGYDPEFLTRVRTSPPLPGRGLTFGYLGTIYGPMPLRETLEGWRLARAKSPLLMKSKLDIHGRLGHYSAPDLGVLEIITQFQEDDVAYAGQVSKTKVSETYLTFDALLLILGRSRFITSGKVYEYAATGLPIISLHDPETASTGILSGHPAWVPTPDLSAEAIAETLIAGAELASAMTSERYAATRRWAGSLSRTRQLEPRVRALTALVSEPRRR